MLPPLHPRNPAIPRFAVVGDIERVLQSVCARRKLACRLRLKNEAAAVEASPQVVQDLEAAAAAAQPMVAALLEQQRRQEAESLGPVGTCAAPAGDSGSGGGGGAKQTCAAPPEASSSSSGSSSSGGGREAAAEGAAADGSPPPRLVSGAGHDAMVLAEAGIPMGMLFVRCRCGCAWRCGECCPAWSPLPPCRPVLLLLLQNFWPARACHALKIRPACTPRMLLPQGRHLARARRARGRGRRGRRHRHAARLPARAAAAGGRSQGVDDVH